MSPREIFEAEMGMARRAWGDPPRAWAHLEQAHILGQPWAGPHSRSHWAMLRLAFRTRNGREMLGQLPRLLLVAPSSWLGVAPSGNVGSTRMGMFEKGKHQDPKGASVSFESNGGNGP